MVKRKRSTQGRCLSCNKWLKKGWILSECANCGESNTQETSMEMLEEEDKEKVFLENGSGVLRAECPSFDDEKEESHAQSADVNLTETNFDSSECERESVNVDVGGEKSDLERPDFGKSDGNFDKSLQKNELLMLKCQNCQRQCDCVLSHETCEQVGAELADYLSAKAGIVEKSEVHWRSKWCLMKKKEGVPSNSDHKCFVCSKPSTIKCTGCEKFFYCSNYHSRIHWYIHILHRIQPPLNKQIHFSPL